MTLGYWDLLFFNELRKKYLQRFIDYSNFKISLYSKKTISPALFAINNNHKNY